MQTVKLKKFDWSKFSTFAVLTEGETDSIYLKFYNRLYEQLTINTISSIYKEKLAILKSLQDIYISDFSYSGTLILGAGSSISGNNSPDLNAFNAFAKDDFIQQILDARKEHDFLHEKITLQVAV